MTIMPRLPIWLLSRRALARISMIVRLGLSSIQMGASARRPMAREIFCQSSAWSWPLRTRVESTRASAHSRRCDSSRLLISSEKNSTGDGLVASRAAWAIIPSAKDVLPMAGRAPTTTSELGCSPERSWSRSR